MNGPQFAKVPRWVFQHSGLTPHQVAVYAYLRWLASPGEECWPGIRQIAAGAGVDRTTVLRAVEALEAAGAVQILETGRGRRASRYRVFHAPLNVVAVSQLTFVIPTAESARSGRIAPP